MSTVLSSYNKEKIQSAIQEYKKIITKLKGFISVIRRANNKILTNNLEFPKHNRENLKRQYITAASTIRRIRGERFSNPLLENKELGEILMLLATAYDNKHKNQPNNNYVNINTKVERFTRRLDGINKQLNAIERTL